jgi:hypothetical protein
MTYVYLTPEPLKCSTMYVCLASALLPLLPQIGTYSVYKVATTFVHVSAVYVQRNSVNLHI